MESDVINYVGRMASRPSHLVTRNVALPPYTWQMTKERTGTVWGVDLHVSDDRVVLLSAYRSLGGRWSWTVLLHRITKKGLAYDTRIARGIERTLTEAKPAAEAATQSWLVQQMGLDPDDLD